jgi:uncharacterized metal-binding protein
MPNARTHDLITLVTAAGANVAYFTCIPHPETTLAVLFTASYIFAGYACAGDLDLNSTEYKRWGRLRFVWWPYQKLIPHRSPLSHGLVVGGLFRIFYLLCMLLFLSWGGAFLYSLYMKTVNPTAFTRQNVLTLDAFVRAHPYQVMAGLSGFILAGTVHSISDFISTWLKKTF